MFIPKTFGASVFPPKGRPSPAASGGGGGERAGPKTANGEPGQPTPEIRVGGAGGGGGWGGGGGKKPFPIRGPHGPPPGPEARVVGASKNRVVLFHRGRSRPGPGTKGRGPGGAGGLFGRGAPPGPDTGSKGASVPAFLPRALRKPFGRPRPGKKAFSGPNSLFVWSRRGPPRAPISKGGWGPGLRRLPQTGVMGGPGVLLTGGRGRGHFSMGVSSKGPGHGGGGPPQRAPPTGVSAPLGDVEGG